MEKPNEQTIGQIAAEDYRKARVFREFGFNFCCGGNNTIAGASAEKEVNPKEVEKAL